MTEAVREGRKNGGRFEKGNKIAVGRKPGVPNKTTTAVKDMILKALDQAGGVEYLAEQAKKNPAAFMQLVGKVLPLQVTGEGGGPIKHEHSLPAAVQDIVAKLGGNPCDKN